MMLKTLVVAALVAAASAQTKYNRTELAELYINLGRSADGNPQTVDCTKYYSLFAKDAVLHEPGVPDATGKGILAACEADHKAISPLISYTQKLIDVHNWEMQVRTAFSWTINGIRTQDNTPVSAPAISFFLQDQQGLIKTAWSFYDPATVHGGPKHETTAGDRAIAEQYIRWGAVGSAPDNLFCTEWVTMFTPNGTNHEPGHADSVGKDMLKQACLRRSQAWYQYVPSYQQVLSVTSWDEQKRIAIQYTMSGETKQSKAAVTPAISILFLNSAGKIEEAWDFFDTTAVPVM